MSRALSQDDKEDLIAIQFLLEKHRKRISIVSQGCSHELLSAKLDESPDGVILTARFINTNDYAHRLV